ncbi:MAG: hypothetical protein V1743_04020 [Nanoarchaeota archaeon]
MARIPTEEVVYEEEFEYDEVMGEKDKKRKMDLLNKKKVTKWEMDELFCEFD